VVDIQMGPDGYLYYVNFDTGKVLRVIYTNEKPTVAITEPTDGAVSVEDDSIDFVASGSDNEDGDGGRHPRIARFGLERGEHPRQHDLQRRF
jgi:hypothetical protein